MFDNLVGKNKIETLTQFALQRIPSYEADPAVGVAALCVLEKGRTQVQGNYVMSSFGQ